MKREEAIIETFQKKKQIGPKDARNTSGGRRSTQGFQNRKHMVVPSLHTLHLRTDLPQGYDALKN